MSMQLTTSKHINTEKRKTRQSIEGKLFGYIFTVFKAFKKSCDEVGIEFPLGLIFDFFYDQNSSKIEQQRIIE
jgi:hypothetical protein